MSFLNRACGAVSLFKWELCRWELIHCKTERNQCSLIPCVGLRISSDTVIALYRLFVALCLMENNSIQSAGGLLQFLKLLCDYTELQVMTSEGQKHYTSKSTEDLISQTLSQTPPEIKKHTCHSEVRPLYWPQYGNKAGTTILRFWMNVLCISSKDFRHTGIKK